MIEPYYDDGTVTLFHGNAEKVATGLEPGSARTIVTSPPYFGLRDYGEAEQIGAEDTLAEYVTRLVRVFAALREVLADDGTLWLNLGDSYAGRANAGPAYTGNHYGFAKGSQVPPRRNSTREAPYKNLLGVPWRVALALQDDGWVLRSDIIWEKPNAMPESVADRPTNAHEYLFLFSKGPRYYYDSDAIAEPHVSATRAGTREREADRSHLPAAQKGDPTKGRPRGAAGFGKAGKNKRSVWKVPTVPFPGTHFAVYPPELIRPCILAGSARGDLVLDPFSGSGTTGLVATQEGRRYAGIDLNRDYLDLSLRTRFAQPVLDLTGGAA